MITIEQINAEIAALEEEKPSYQVMERLANLYVVRDHMIGAGDNSAKTVQILPNFDSDSAFAQAIKKKNVCDTLALFDELMAALEVTNPRLHDCVMAKI